MANIPVTPIDELCKRLRTNRKGLATGLSVRYEQIDHCANGRHPTVQPRLLRALLAAGLDAQEFQRRYDAWYRSRSESLRSGFVAGAGVESGAR